MSNRPALRYLCGAIPTVGAEAVAVGRDAPDAAVDAAAGDAVAAVAVADQPPPASVHHQAGPDAPLDPAAPDRLLAPPTARHLPGEWEPRIFPPRSQLSRRQEESVASRQESDTPSRRPRRHSLRVPTLHERARCSTWSLCVCPLRLRTHEGLHVRPESNDKLWEFLRPGADRHTRRRHPRYHGLFARPGASSRR